MTQLTIITPIAPHHQEHFPKAAQSVLQQTIPCAHLHMVDYEGRGPGWVRNRLLERTQTEFVTFLDADDTLLPEFAATALAAMPDVGYVYTDWYREEKNGKLTHCAAETYSAGKGFHLVNAVLRTEDARRSGGFDETLRGVEDRDFYLKLMCSGVCPVHVPVPLVVYSPHGKRSASLGHDTRGIKLSIDQRYDMGCCGDNGGQRRMSETGNDVLAIVIAQERRFQGKISGRLYKRTGANQKVKADPRDVAAAPEHFRPIAPLKPAPLDEQLQRAIANAHEAIDPHMAVTAVQPPDKPEQPPRQGVQGLADALTDSGLVREDVRVSAQESIDTTPDFERIAGIVDRVYGDA